MSLQFNVGISFAFGPFEAFKIEAPFKKDCGLNMKGIFVSQWGSRSDGRSTRLGPLVCRESFETMVIPQVGDKEGPEDGEMGFTADQMAPMEVWAGELLKNVSLGLLISMSFFFALMVPFHVWTVGPRCPKFACCCCSWAKIACCCCCSCFC